MRRITILGVAGLAVGLVLGCPLALVRADDAKPLMKKFFYRTKHAGIGGYHVVKATVTMHRHSLAEGAAPSVVVGHGELTLNPETGDIEGEIFTRQNPHFERTALVFFVKIKESASVSVQWLLNGKHYLGRGPEVFEPSAWRRREWEFSLLLQKVVGDKSYTLSLELHWKPLP